MLRSVGWFEHIPARHNFASAVHAGAIHAPEVAVAATAVAVGAAAAAVAMTKLGRNRAEETI